MKEKGILVFFIIAQFICSANLKVIFSNLRSYDGEIEIGLYNSPKGFPKDGFAFKRVRFKADSLKTYFLFKNIPEGEYAIAAYHDENNNKKCDMNPIGLPRECYGFSNNMKKGFFLPSFDKCKFNIIKDTVITINLKCRRK